MTYIPRLIEALVSRYLKLFPAVSVTGPRQSGKSTTIKQVFGSQYRYVTFDDPLQVEFFISDPRGYFQTYSDRVIFDEAQKVPEIFQYIKMAIDSDRSNYGKFLLTGSSQFAFVRDISESLAGRVGSVSLLPFQLVEAPADVQDELILKGSYPELVTRDFVGYTEWYSAYTNNYLERDVRSLYNVGNLQDFQRLIMLLAARVAQELNASALARDLGVSVKTVQSWVSILEASYILFLLPSYHKNLGKRIVKRPKLFFYDTGIICYLTGLRDREVLEKGPLAGPVFENFVVSEILKTIQHRGYDIRLYYFRSNGGLEADLILHDLERGEISFLEVKHTGTVRIKMAENLKKLVELEESAAKPGSSRANGYILHKGSDTPIAAEKIRFMNYKTFLQEFASKAPEPGFFAYRSL